MQDFFSDSLARLKPLVSVHMLAYNHGAFIEQSIKSIINQKRNFPIELIIGEDCSTDDTKEIVIYYHRKYPDLIRVVTDDVNVGMRANSLRSIPLCRGRYIAFCEGDDFWQNPNKIEMQARLMESNPDMAFCHTDYNRLTGAGTSQKINKTEYRTPPQGKAYESLLVEYSIMTATTIYRRDVVLDFISSEFYNTAWPFGDLSLDLYASLRGVLGYIDESTATWRKRRGSATNSGFRKLLHMEQCALDCVEKFIEKYPVSENIKNIAIANRRRVLWRLAYFCGNRDLMQEHSSWLARHKMPPPENLEKFRKLCLDLYFPWAIHSKIKEVSEKYFQAVGR